MKRSRFWFSALLAALVIGWSSFQWGITAAQAQQAPDPFTTAAAECLTQQSLAACDRAIDLNDADPLPWYGKIEAHRARDEFAAAEAAFRQFDLLNRYYSVILGPLNQLREHLLFKELLASEEQVSALEQEIVQTQAAVRDTNLNTEERTAAQNQLERLQGIRSVYDELKANPQRLPQIRREAIEVLVELRQGFAAAWAEAAQS
ncbi:MAG: hypothetical protein AAGG51_27220 [Cyanobacteria bacterium P01_G01_bin.54]